MILFIHSRYRVSGGEERAVDNLMALVREQLGEDVELLERDAAVLGRGRAASAMLRGGLRPEDVAHAVKRTGARIVHAHNLNPTLGWRALAGARHAGARVVVHLHNYRLVCAVGVCFTGGAPCTRCHGANTLPGVVHGCRGGIAEALVYASSLALWQRRVAGGADAFIVPSDFARRRLHELGAPVGTPHVLPHPLDELAGAPAAMPGGHALFAGRLEPEKGLEVAIDACAIAGIPLVVAGTGSQRARFEGTSGVRFTGAVDGDQLRSLRAGAAVALVPSLFAETFGFAAAEAMAAGLPVAASRIGALPELVPEAWLAPPGDAAALAGVITALAGDATAGARALAAISEQLDPRRLAATLSAIYS